MFYNIRTELFLRGIGKQRKYTAYMMLFSLSNECISSFFQIAVLDSIAFVCVSMSLFVMVQTQTKGFT